MTPTPEAAFGPRSEERSPGPFLLVIGPLKGATPAARQCRLRGVRLQGGNAQ
jgi:hypothetical protein